MPRHSSFPLLLPLMVALSLSACGGCGEAPLESQPTALVISPDQVQLFIGQRLSLRLVAAFPDSTTREVPPGEATWSSSAPSLVTVEGGVATALRQGGNVQLRAEWNGLSAVAGASVDEARLTSLTATPARARLVVGQSQALRIVGTLSDERTIDLTQPEFGTTYSSAESAIASVSPTGEIVAVAAGEVEVTVRNGEAEAKVAVEVSTEPITLQSLELRPLRQSLTVGTSGALQVIARFSDGDERDVTADEEVSYASGDAAALAVEPGGVLRARIAASSVPVTVSFEDQRAIALVDVVASALESLRIEPKSLVLALRGTAALRVFGRYADGHEQDLSSDLATTFESTQAGLVTVEGARVTGVAAGGPVRVIARYRGREAELLVTVLPATLEALTLTPTTGDVRIRETLQLLATGTMSEGTTRDLTLESAGTTYETAPSGFLTISASGLVRGERRGGPVVVTARNAGREARASLTVVVGADQLLALAITPVSARVDLSQTLRLRVDGTFGDGRVADVTPASTGTRYASSQPGLLSVSADGLVEGLAFGGPVLVSAGNQGLSATSTVLVAAPPPSLLGLTVEPRSLQGNVGTTTQLHVSGRFSDGASRDLSAASTGVRYELSGDPAVASISPDGRVTLKGSGTAVVLVSFESMREAVTITVAPHVLLELRVAPILLELPVGFSEQIQVTGVFSDGTLAELTTASTGTVYSSAKPNIAEVSADGRVSSLSSGKSVISVANSGLVRMLQVRMRDAEVATVAATAAIASIPAGRTTQLTCTATLSNGRLLDVTPSSSGTTWVSGNTSTVTVSAEGLVTGVGVGAATVSCLNHGAAAATTVTVTPAVADDVVISPESARIPLGRLLPLRVSVKLSDGSVRDATSGASGTVYLTSDPSKATVSVDGVVKGLAIGGPLTITAVTGGRTRTALIEVTAPALESLRCAPTRLGLAPGATSLLVVHGRYSDGNEAALSAAQGLTFRSEDLAVATVEAAGLVMAVAVGSTMIDAYADGLVARCEVSVAE